MGRLPISLAELEAILAVAETGSFSLAAEQLAISQSAISARVRSSEEIMGIKFFHRTTRRVTMTEQGSRLAARAAVALSELHAVLDEFKDEANLSRGKVILGATPTVAPVILPMITKEFQEKFPKIEITMYDDFIGEALERVSLGEVDFALTPVNEEFHAKNLKFEHLYNEEFLLIVPEDHHLSNRREVSLEDISRCDIISAPPRAAIYSRTKKIFADAGFQYRPTMHVLHILSIVSLVQSGLGVSLVPEGVLRMVRLDGIKVIEIPRLGLRRQIVVATARDRSLQPPARAFLSHVTAKVALYSSFRTRPGD